MMWLARSAVRRPRQWLAAAIAVTAVLAVGIPQLELETGGARLYPDGNAVVEASKVDQVLFQEPRQVFLLVSCTQPGCLET